VKDNLNLTLSQKIIAKASGIVNPQINTIVTCKIDLALMHDSSGPRRIASRMKELGVKVWNPEKIVLVSDHFVPATDVESAQILALTRNWADENKLSHFYDMQGICHVILPEKGHLKPGMFAVGGDSHSPSGGAFGCFMVGIGATEMAGVLATGEIWIKVPETIQINWHGKLKTGLSAKDMMLFLCRQHGMNNNYKVFEFAGSTITKMSQLDRMVLCNMSAELGGKTGIIAPDKKTIESIKRHGGVFTGDIKYWQSDSNATFAQQYYYDAEKLEPQVAAPHSPENSANASSYSKQKINQAYIGACTGAKLNDLKMAARVLKNQKVAKGIRLYIAPASLETTRNAINDGTMKILTDAGATLLPTGCGACAGMGAGILADNEVCISSTSRNFKGRMGSNNSQVFLASPFTVAASAIKGEICDPREFLEG